MSDSEEVDGGVHQKLAEVDGLEVVEIECAVAIEDSEVCDGWSERVELESPARYESERIYLPGFNWECPECGNPHEFNVEGIRVSNLV